MTAAQRFSLGLTAVTALALAAHLQAQPLWLAGLLASLLALRAILTQAGIQRLPRGLLLLLAALLFALVFQAHHSLIGRDGGMALLASLVILKLFETRDSTRDSHVVLMLDYFCTGTSFLHAQSLAMFGFSLFCIACITMQVLLLQRPASSIRLHARLAGRMLFEAIPLAVVLFLFFPRLPGPLWHMPVERSARSGLSGDRMEPGQVSRLALDDSIAFRVEFDGMPPRHSALYWRGPVFEHFDGRRWLPLPRQQAAPTITALGPNITYRITLEPHQQRWLLALDLPVSLPAGARINGKLQVLSPQALTQRQRYELTSSLSWRIERDPNLASALQLPGAGNPRSRELAAQWSGLPAERRVRAALDYLRSQHFSYTLEPPPLQTSQAIDEFLFETRQGFCEHFAGAFTFLMRAAGVPARIVTGYQGGEYNTAGRYLIVRQADAHAWSEVWLEGRGWQRVDPTAMAAPERIESGLAGSVPQGDNLPFMLRAGDNWIKNLRLQMDVLVNGWNQWVIGFDAQRQRDFLQKLGIEDFLSVRYLGWLLGCCTLILAGFALATLRPGAPRYRDPAARLYREFCRKLARRGVHRAEPEGPLDFARRAGDALPELAASINAITADYLAVRYGEKIERLPGLRRMIKSL